MIALIYGQDQAVADWVQARLPEIRNGFGLCTAIGLWDGKPIAGVVYHEYRVFNLQMSIAAESPLWCNRRTLRALLGYPFLQLGVARVTACTAKHNKPSRALLERLGFQLEGRIRAGYDGTRDLLVYGLLRKEADRWITNAVRRQERHHERQSASALAA